MNQEVIELYDDYAHGRLSRRDYMTRLTAFAVGVLTVETLLQNLSPNYAWAQQIDPKDPRIQTDMITYRSPDAAGWISRQRR